MRKETKKAPTIRFRGFTDDWEQRKLGEIFTERSEKKHEYLPPLTIIQGCGTVRRDEMDRELIYDKSSLSNYKLVKKNDFIVHLRSFEGGLEKSNIEGIVSSAYHIFHGEKINTEFYYSFFRSNDFINHKLVPFVYGIRDGRSIDIAGMKTIKIPYPSVNEQNHIGTLIGQLNSLIALHQRKLSQLKKLKKYFLQNMFPAKGEKVPRIRFKGFTGDWEQRKLEDLASFSKGAGYSKSDLQASGTPIVLYGRLYTKYETVIKDIDTFVDALADSVYSQGGEVIVPASGETAEDISIASVVEKPGIVLGGDLNIIHPSDDLDSTFLAISISNGNPHKEMAKRAQGKSVVHLHNNDLAQIKLLYPSVTEQRKISQYFSGLDTLITLHQHKLDQLQTMKKFMLQNLFI